MTIASYIEQDLEARLAAGAADIEKMTLGSLAKHYDVSITPVREAVGKLLERAILAKAANGRLCVNESWSCDVKSASPKVDVVPPKDWEEILANEVLKLSLQGNEDFLREESFAKQFGISRTILRRVFGQLAIRGLLEHVARRGWKVRPFREGEVLAYLEVRETLELKALELAKENLEQKVLEQMLAGNQPLETRGEKQLDNNLHQYIIEKSNNRFIKDFFTNSGGYFTALFDYAGLEPAMIEEMAKQHREILTFVIACQWKKARQALSHHIQFQVPVLLNLIGKISKVET